MTARLSYVYDGTSCLGFILERGRAGHEAFDREEISLGVFKTPAAAANAVFNSAMREKGAG